ncbi:Eco57I restriction-modification methylase domain-containing protein, partial [Acidiphilium rubrum]|uniref:Eco57I restriction-modification methylase domain-containing protein n=2 Tax=Acidiphilium TaxID=522 RepID=UPI002CDD1476
MARKPITDMSAWPSLTLEGNLIAPAMVANIDRRQAPEQTEEHYRVRKGLTIREEISTAFRVGQSHYDDFAKLQNPSVEATRRFVRGFLTETFGFDDLAPAEGTISFLAGNRVPIVVVPPADEKLDRRSPTLSTERARSPALALQDYLNDSEDALWGLVTNGAVIRLMRDNASLTRPAYIEADLAAIFTNEDAASFAVLWSLIHRTRFGIAGTPITDCALERWREAGTREGEAARDRLAAQVEIALKVLGSGFLEANPDLAARLRSGEVNLTEWFNELLRFVYRLIFLMVAEDRNLLHPTNVSPEARKLYAEGYSLAALRAQSVRAASWDKYHDRYEGMKIVFRALAHGQPTLGLPVLGGLFDAEMLPQLETGRLRNRAFMEALYRLSWLPGKVGVTPVNWRAMETEELGSVYESLLELTPRLTDDGRSISFAEGAEQKGNARKTTGSYYTPDALVQTLLDSALDPVLDRVAAEAEDPVTALLGVTVIDPACGSGHFLLAAGRRIATRLARARAGGLASAEDYRHALRDVARACLHGVDRNPMAVELTKVALWIETVDPGKPLGFLDANIRCGDALLGLFDMAALADGIPEAAYKPLTGDDKPTAKYYAARNRDERRGQGSLDFARGGGDLPASGPLAQARATLRALPEDSAEQIANKRRRFEQARADRLSYTWGEAADLFIAAFLLPKTGGLPRLGEAPLVPTTGDVWRALADRQVQPPLVARSTEMARTARAFHWPLEFPDVMAAGGFDVVLGNPPWERIKLQEQEFFAALDPEIATAPNAAARGRLIAALVKAEPGTRERTLHEAFKTAKRLAEASSIFAREGGRFPLTGRGDVNTYALFAEHFANLASKRGRAGVIVPTGLITDYTTSAFFSSLTESERLICSLAFDNQKKIFPGIHADTPFTLLTFGAAENNPEFAAYILKIEHLGDPERRYRLSPADIARINPNTKTAPVFRARADAALTAKIYGRVPVLINEAKGPAGNPWGVSFSAMFHMSNDSGLFRTAAQLNTEGFVRDATDWRNDTARYVPLYEAKMIHQFDHRWATYDGTESRDTTEAEKQNPDFEPVPRYWVPEAEVTDRLRAKSWTRGWLMGLRGITNATNERTIISGLWPCSGVGNSCHVWFIENNNSAPQLAALYGSMCSLAMDYVARQKVGGTNLNFFYVEQLPILPPLTYTEPDLAFIVPRVLELTYTSHALTHFARDLGYHGKPFAWNEDRRAHLRAELDAFYARAYGLTRDELRYILDPEDAMGPGYPSETFRVLKKNDIARHGEYRTARLALLSNFGPAVMANFGPP